MNFEIALAMLSEPTAIPLWGVFALAAGMYPVGLMLGSQCSPCCTPCGCPPDEQLPDALLVSFSGLTKAATKIENLLSLQFSSCFGGGAAGTVEAPGGLSGAGGPISAVTLASGGNGYAVLGRVQPTALSISAAVGTGAQFSISLTQTSDECSLPAWKVSTVAVTKAGAGYANGQALTLSLGANEFEGQAASLTLSTTPSEPTISATVTETAGVGLSLSVTPTQVASGPNRWGVSKVSVTAGGSGYGDKQPVAFSVAPGETTVSAAVAVVRVTRLAPTVVGHYYGAGTGATFSPTLTKTTYNGDDVWEVASAGVASGGTGYADNENVIFFSDTVGEINDVDSYWKIVTNGSGVVTSLTKTSGGRFWAENGIVDRVEVSDAGSYYGDSTNAASVTVNDGGRYYKERSDIPAHVASVTASVSQTAPSAGAGAAFSVTVDDNPASATFGQVTAVSPTAGGSGYLKWSYTVSECCIENWNGNTFLLPKSESDSCLYSVTCCGMGTVEVRYNGVNVYPTARILSGCGMPFDITSEAPFSCDAFSFSGADVFGTGTISVEPATAGEVPADYPCPGCCNGAETSACNEEDCLSAGGTWWQQCTCGDCGLGNCEGYELIVELTVDLNPAYAPAGGALQAVHTLTLNAGNDWSDNNTIGANNTASAHVVLSGGQPTCAVYAYAQIPAIGIIGYADVQTRDGLCLSPGAVLLPSALNQDGNICPVDGATEFCGQVGPMAPGVWPPFVPTSLLVTITVVTP